MISLVTACMNREMHLRQSLQRWLGIPGIGEIIVVDWSNSQPLKYLTSMNPRIRVVRAEGEARWVLSYAYNLGISRAAGDVIMKIDADCLPHGEVAALEPGPAHFFAGDWRLGAKLGRPSVNGQSVFLKSQFDAVNGYSEFIRTYGRDDEDLYDRLIAAGFDRREIPASSLDFIEHGPEARMAYQPVPGGVEDLEGWLLGNLEFNEVRNFWLARLLPWNRMRMRASYREIESGGRWQAVRRDAAGELPIPAETERAARLGALRYVTRRLLGLPAERADRLDERACLALIGNRLGKGVGGAAPTGRSAREPTMLPLKTEPNKDCVGSIPRLGEC